jgi:hypothetical protein
MATERTTGYTQKRYVGRTLVTLGAAAMLTDLAFLIYPLTPLLESAKAGLLGIVPALSLSLLNVARAFAFHQVDYFSLVSRILVLFSALVAVVVGTALWKARPRALGRSRLPDSVEGDR